MKGLSILRKQRKLTQSALAKIFGVEMNTVWKWENTSMSPSLDIIQKLADFFNVSVDELLNGPADESYKVTLKFVKNIEEVHGEMLINGCGAVSLADDGTVVASHMGKLSSREDKARILAAIDQKLEEALETVERRTERIRAEAGKHDA